MKKVQTFIVWATEFFKTYSFRQHGICQRTLNYNKMTKIKKIKKQRPPDMEKYRDGQRKKKMQPEKKERFRGRFDEE